MTHLLVIGGTDAGIVARLRSGATPIHIKTTGDAGTGKLLGAQMTGHRGSAAARRIDIRAAAPHSGMTVDAVSDLDLSYTPSLGSPYDAVQAAAHTWTLAHRL